MAPINETARRKGRLQTESLHLAKRYGPVRFDTIDGAWLHIKHFALPPGWNKKEVEILIDVPWGTPGYPSVAPQWFWTDHDLKTETGRPIGHFFAEGAGNSDRKHINAGWGHFCVHMNEWHPSAGNDILNGHSLIAYLNLIRVIFHERPKLER